MKILLVHNAYRQRGGEDAVFADEQRLLQDNGHEVRAYVRHNDEIALQPPWRSAAETVWSVRSHAAVAHLIEDWRPDVMHLHNSLALVSPAVIWAAARRGVPVVVTLHNFRLACLQGTFMRQGEVCEDCLGHVPWRGVARACYRGSRAQSAVLATSLLTHRALGTWRKQVHRFIALDAASVLQFVAVGVPAERIRLKPNFAWPAPQAPLTRDGGLFVGRLAPEKGVAVLAQALQRVTGLPMQIIGEGPERALLEGVGARLLGALPPDAVQWHMLRAAWLAIPSITQEQFPRVLAEAFAAGLPVVVAARGALARLVVDGETGLHVRPGDPADLAAKLAWAQAHPQQMAAMGQRARQVHAQLYSPHVAHQMLMAIYAEARQLAGLEPAA